MMTTTTTMAIQQKISLNRFLGVYLLHIFVTIVCLIKLLPVIIDHLMLNIFHLFLLFVFVNCCFILILDIIVLILFGDLSK